MLAPTNLFLFLFFPFFLFFSSLNASQGTSRQAGAPGLGLASGPTDVAGPGRAPPPKKPRPRRLREAAAVMGKGKEGKGGEKGHLCGTILGPVPWLSRCGATGYPQGWGRAIIIASGVNGGTPAPQGCRHTSSTSCGRAQPGRELSALQPGAAGVVGRVPGGRTGPGIGVGKQDPVPATRRLPPRRLPPAGTCVPVACWCRGRVWWCLSAPGACHRHRVAAVPIVQPPLSPHTHPWCRTRSTPRALSCLGSVCSWDQPSPLLAVPRPVPCPLGACPPLQQRKGLSA